MDLSKLSTPLPIDQIEFRVQSVAKGYVTLLAYKDARADMKRLDEVCTPLGWTRSHSRDNKNCTVSIWCDEKKQWISKEDTGSESNTEANKGLASDSFKRACFNLGIGRELYDYPRLFLKLNDNEWKLNEKKKDNYGNPKPETTWDFKLKEWRWASVFSDEGVLLVLRAKDEKGNMRFNYDIRTDEQKTKK